MEVWCNLLERGKLSGIPCVINYSGEIVVHGTLEAGKKYLLSTWYIVG